MITFKTTTNFSGTSLRGEVKTTYDQLVSVFGLPLYGPNDNGDKVTCEWCLEFEDGTVATIYDWKTDSTPYDLYSWHIGGKNSKAVELVLQSLENTNMNNKNVVHLQNSARSRYNQLLERMTEVCQDMNNLMQVPVYKDLPEVVAGEFFSSLDDALEFVSLHIEN